MEHETRTQPLHNGWGGSVLIKRGKGLYKQRLLANLKGVLQISSLLIVWFVQVTMECKVYSWLLWVNAEEKLTFVQKYVNRYCFKFLELLRRGVVILKVVLNNWNLFNFKIYFENWSVLKNNSKVPSELELPSETLRGEAWKRKHPSTAWFLWHLQKRNFLVKLLRQRQRDLEDRLYVTKMVHAQRAQST